MSERDLKTVVEKDLLSPYFLLWAGSTPQTSTFLMSSFQ